MFTAGLPSGLARRAIALSMAAIVAFLGIAVFSSLHKHQGANKRCSLNGFDHQAVGEAEQAATLDPSGSLDWRDTLHDQDAAGGVSPASLFLRGPPAAA